MGLFKAISIFLTSMEEVILLGLSGTTKSSLTWSSGGNTFSFCLNKDFGGTFGWKLNVDFFLAGLLEVGELLWHLYTLSTWVPRSVISLCSLSVWSAFSLKTLSPSKNFSNLSNSLLDFMHKTDEAVLSLLTGNPSTDDNFAAIFCAPWNAHRQISWTFHIQILYIKIYITHSAKIIYTIYTIYRRQSFYLSYRNTAHVIRHPSNSLHYAPFYASLPLVQTCPIAKTNRSHKKPVWRVILFQKWGS